MFSFRKALNVRNVIEKLNKKQELCYTSTSNSGVTHVDADFPGSLKLRAESSATGFMHHHSGVEQALFVDKFLEANIRTQILVSA